MWSEMYPLIKEPTLKEISNYIQNPLWNDLCSFLETKYSVSPKTEYSRCSMAKGWNVKYKKGNKSICTLYPNDGYFTCLITIGEKYKMEADFLASMCCEYVQNIYKSTKSLNGNTWLMIDITSQKILEDVKNLIDLKVK